MHIPDNYLSPQTDAVMAVAMVPVWVHSVRTVRKTLDRKHLSFLGICAAFSFLLMMFNVPLPGGTTGHAVGGSLIALLLGPEAACIAVSVALAIQALLFGDGGILSFGANCFNMAFVLPFVAYGLYVLLRKVLPDGWKERVAEFVSGYIGITLAAFCVALELGVQPLLFKAADGQALYFPFTFNVTIPAMLIPHLAVASVVEGLVTVVVVEFVRRTAPEIIEDNARVNFAETAGADGKQVAHAGLRKSAWIALAVVAVLSPIGLLATGDAWGEWGAEDFMSATGLNYVPQYIAHGFSWDALLPDYSLQGLPDIAGYILSAVIGIAVLTIVFRLLALAVSGNGKTSAR